MTSNATLQGNVAALVHHVELSKAGWRARALETMVVSTCFDSDSPLTANEIASRLNAQLDSPLATAQVESALHSLLSRGRCVRFSDGTLKLAESTATQLEQNFSDATTLEQAVVEFFRSHFDVLPVSARPAWDTFKSSFLNPLISQLGARTYEIMSGGEGSPADASAYLSFVDSFPRNLRTALTDSIAAFFDPRNANVRRFILGRLNATFLVQATALSDDAFQALTHTTSRRLDMKVFVDTNFLFSLIGLHDNPADDVVAALDNLIQRTGGQTRVTLYVLPITLDEARETIARQAERLSGIVMDKHFAKALRRGSIDLGGIAARFFREAFHVDKPISATEYYRPYVDNMLEVCRANGVELYNVNMDELRQDDDVISDLLDEQSFQGRTRKRGPKPYPVILHDMMLWHFVSRQRPPTVESPVEAGHWIATIDFGLLRFDAHKNRKHGRSLPIAIHPTVLLQMLQFWVPQSEDLEVALINSLQPLLPQEFDIDAEQVTLRILQVLSRYENARDIGEETLSNILVDDAVRARLQETDDTAEQINVVETALARQVDEGRRETKSLRQAKKRLEERVREREDEIRQITAQLEEARQDTQQAYGRLTDATARAGGLESRLQQLEEEAQRRRVRQNRTTFALVSILGIGILCTTSIIVFAPVLVRAWPLGPTVAIGLCAVAGSLLGLAGADVLGRRMVEVRAWKPYAALHKLRRSLWTALTALALGVVASLIADQLSR